VCAQWLLLYQCHMHHYLGPSTRLFIIQNSTHAHPQVEADVVLFATGIRVNSSFLSQEVGDCKDPATGAIKVRGRGFGGYLFGGGGGVEVMVGRGVGRRLGGGL
jgi:hypothetical protein